MKPYASYKPSGVPWLGDVPAHWAGKRLRDCVEGCSNGVWGDDPDGGDDDIPVIRVADFDRVSRQVVEYETLRKVDSGQRGSRALVPGDMLMEKSGGGEQQPVGMVVSYLGPEGAVCSNFVARMRSREGVVSRFMVYLHAYLYASRVTNISVKQTTGIQNLDSTAYLSEACFVPPPDEQQAIADYLDGETARIDTLIHEKDELIGLLREARVSAVSSILLEGMARRAKKASNTKWLGDVPASWVVCRVKHVLMRIEQGWSPECENRLCAPGEWGVLKAGACNHGKFNQTEHKFLPVTLDPIPEYEVFAGDVLMSRASGSADLVGSVAYVDEVQPHLMLSDKLFRLVPEEHVDGRYLAWVLNTDAQRRQILDCVRGAEGLARNITTTDIKQLWIALPSLDEQKQLAVEADKIANGFDDLIAHTHDEITLLKELRAATIADAVLGRIDVRGSAKTIAACA
jgi:type I restriction enzyme S subunit